MSLIQKRLARNYDHLIGEESFGFKAKRSTSQATFIISRTQDFCEQTKKPVSFLFLDWEKVFDRILHHRMFEEFVKLSISKWILSRLSDCYTQAFSEKPHV